MTNKEKFLKMASKDKTNTIELAKFRLAKYRLIKSAYNVVLQRCDSKCIESVMENIDYKTGWCTMFNDNGFLASPPFKDLGFGYSYSSKMIDVKEVGESILWRPKCLKII